MSIPTLIDHKLKEFNLSAFRPGQKEIIADVLKGKDVLGVLPTGTGKSLCYQLPAKLFDGVTIVVSPLIALMIDQVKQLKANHFKEVVALNSFMDWDERKDTYKHLNAYKLIYVSPELLQNETLLDYLTQLKISLFVIDEAHCLSQWGHEFRPDYLRLVTILDRLGKPPILALSATVTETVQADIQTILKRSRIVKHIYPIDRANITYTVQQVSSSKQKLTIISDILSRFRVPTIIYFSSRQVAERVADALNTGLSGRRQIAFYHGGMDQADRVMVQQQFMNDQLDVVCCTSAFGMGINKNNIRLVIHYHLSTQIESYIQEVGRAGRDGGESLSLLLHDKKDIYIPLNLIENELPTKKMLESIFHKLYELNSQSKHVPSDLEEIQGIFGINETQWRFVHYQLEKNHLIIENQLIDYQQSQWEEAFKQILAVQQDRYSFKQFKLKEMIDWVNGAGCLRKHLYQSFQPSYTPARFQCCSHCGFTLADWKPEQTKKVENAAKMISWQQKLADLLMVGEYETR